MQYLYMMAAQIREQEMRKMAIQITQGLLNVDDAMLQYNVATKDAVLKRVENFKRESNLSAAKKQSDFMDINVQAA
ncbi:MAG: hypothetical protein EOP42_07225 [Sphingobacteriaceae bacterium]|nr:MAG: hypothetical protein EOP42_07225 [Sphingobacteriaceae bacterium]